MFRLKLFQYFLDLWFSTIDLLKIEPPGKWYREVYHVMYHAKEIPWYTGVPIFLHTTSGKSGIFVSEGGHPVLPYGQKSKGEGI